MEEQKRRRERKSAAYWLSKSSILYPICILYVMYVKQVEVYITECSVHISSGTMLFAYALCLILWLASPIRSYCADGTANEVLFYTFPPSILMLFLFAQYSLKIVLFLAVLDGIFLVTVLRDLHRKKRKYSPKNSTIRRHNTAAACLKSAGQNAEEKNRNKTVRPLAM